MIADITEEGVASKKKKKTEEEIIILFLLTWDLHWTG